MNKKATKDQPIAEPNNAVTQTSTPEADVPLKPEQQLFEIRDLLFGEQQRLIELRIQNLEKNMQRKLQEMNDVFSNALNTLRQDSHAKLEELASHVEDLSKKHTENEHNLGADISDLQHHLNETRSELMQADSDLDTHLNNEANRLMNELTKKYDELMANLNNTSEELKNNKADRKTLATLLASVANNLNENE